MLVLTRCKGEKIVLPELGITVQVVRVRGRAVRLGVTAPPEVKILRGELLGGDSLSTFPEGRPLPSA